MKWSNYRFDLLDWLSKRELFRVLAKKTQNRDIILFFILRAFASILLQHVFLIELSVVFFFICSLSVYSLRLWHCRVAIYEYYTIPYLHLTIFTCVPFHLCIDIVGDTWYHHLTHFAIFCQCVDYSFCCA